MRTKHFKKKEVPNHGDVQATNRKYKIIDLPDGRYSVKKRFGPFYVFIRTKGRKIIFDDFAEVVTYVLKRKKQDAMSEV